MNTSTPIHMAARRQRGSVVISSAIALSMLVIVLLGSELGYLFFMKREYQKAADLAATAGAQAVQPTNCGPAQTAAVANAALNLSNPAVITAASVVCGRWDAATMPAPHHFLAGSQPFNAVRVQIDHAPALLLPGLPGNQSRTLQLMAQAAQLQPLAVLNIRSTLASVSSDRSALLNALFNGLLGGSLDIDMVGWKGLATTDLKLFSYLDQLAIDLNLTAGDYDAVLATNASVGTLLSAAAKVLDRDGNTAQAALSALDAIRLAGDIPAIPMIRLGDVLNLQTGVQTAGLDTTVQLLQLIEGLVFQAADGVSAVSAEIPVPSIPNVVAGKAYVKIIEAGRISAVGNPELAELEPLGPDRIFVRTAQVRTLVSMNMPALSIPSTIINSVLGPVTDVLNSLLGKGLVSGLAELLGCALGCDRIVTDIKVLPNPRLDILIEAGGGQSHVTEVDCTSGARNLRTSTTTNGATIRIGQLGATPAAARTNAFSGGMPLAADPIPILDIGSMECRLGLLGIGRVSCKTATRVPYSGGGLGIQANPPSLLGDTQTQTFDNPPALEEAPIYQTATSQNIVNSIGNTLGGLNVLTAIAPTGTAPSLLGSVLTGLTTALGAVLNLAQTAVNTLLSPLLDPLLNALLKDVLGVNLAETEVGARLSCNRAVELVY